MGILSPNEEMSIFSPIKKGAFSTFPFLFRLDQTSLDLDSDNSHHHFALKCILIPVPTSNQTPHEFLISILTLLMYHVTKTLISQVSGTSREHW